MVIPSGGLYLTRVTGQGIQVGDSIYVEVCAVKGKKVSLRIVAPDEVTIKRNEIVGSNRDRIKTKRKEGATNGGNQ